MSGPLNLQVGFCFPHAKLVAKKRGSTKGSASRTLPESVKCLAHCTGRFGGKRKKWCPLGSPNWLRLGQQRFVLVDLDFTIWALVKCITNIHMYIYRLYMHFLWQGNVSRKHTEPWGILGPRVTPGNRNLGRVAKSCCLFECLELEIPARQQDLDFKDCQVPTIRLRAVCSAHGSHSALSDVLACQPRYEHLSQSIPPKDW